MFSMTLSRLPLIGMLSFTFGVIILFGTKVGAAAIVGVFLLVYAAICITLHMIFSLMRDHEAWKRRLASEADRARAQ